MPALMCVRRDFLGLGLLDESLDVALPVGLHQPVRGRVVDWREHDRGAGLALAVQADHRARSICVITSPLNTTTDSVSLSPAYLIAPAVPSGAGSTTYRILDAQIAAVPEHLFDAARLVVEAEDDFVDLRDLLQQIDLVMQERPVEDRNDRLGRMNRQRPQTRALAPCEKDSFHDNPPIITRW